MVGRYEDTKQWILRQPAKPEVVVDMDLGADALDSLSMEDRVDSPVEVKNWRYHLTNDKF